MEEQKKSLGVDGDHQSTGTGGSAMLQSAGPQPEPPVCMSSITGGPAGEHRDAG